MTPPTVQFIPAAAAGYTDDIGSVTQWTAGTSPILVDSVGYWTAGTYAGGITRFRVYDSGTYGFFMYFDTNANREAFYTTHGFTRDMVVVHPGGEYYWTNTSGMTRFGGIYLYCNQSGLSGTAPSSTNSATVFLV
jgi:hypothetical protein